MIHWDDRGPQSWNGVHVTHTTTVAGPSTSTTSAPRAPCSPGSTCSGTPALARRGDRRGAQAGKRILAIGSGWALSEINITDGWLVNTKLLNGCYDVADPTSTPPIRPPPPRRRCRPGRDADRRAQRLSRADPGGRGLKRALKAAGIGNGQTIAGAVSGNTHGSQINFGRCRLRRRPPHRHRQRPDTVDREGVEAGAQRGLRRTARRRADPRRRHLQRGRGQLRHVRDHRGGGGRDAPVYQIAFPPSATSTTTP